MIRCLLLMIVLLVPWISMAQETQTLYYNGQVFTGQTDRPDARWFVVEKGRIVSVGPEKGIPEAWSSAHQKIDLHGKFITPGFVDAHIHFVDGGLSLLQTDLGQANTPKKLSQIFKASLTSPTGGWVIFRNLGLESFGNQLPDHKDFESLADNFNQYPVFILLNDGHHIYVNRKGLSLLKKDSQGTQGLFVDEEAWDILRKVYQSLPPAMIASAMLKAQEQTLSYGITTIGDNTFFPHHMAQYKKLKKAGFFPLRVMSRSYGPIPITKALMGGIGTNQFFGEKYFLDSSLGLVSKNLEDQKVPPGGFSRYTDEELKKIFLYAGSSGLAFHTQGRESIEQLLKIRSATKHRRHSKKPDVLDHCGSCGDVSDRIRQEEFKVTLLPRQFFDLPNLSKTFGSEEALRLLDFRSLVQASVNPAFTSDWPYGLSTPPVKGDVDFVKLSLSPLAGIAVATSGKTPDGRLIPHTQGKTVSVSQALLGSTRHGAAAVGRPDLGLIAPGQWADFVILPSSPFHASLRDLYTMTVEATYIEGKQVYRLNEPRTEIDVSPFSSWPHGWTPSPIIGYDPTRGIILGGALFFYSYQESGYFGDIQIMATPKQGAINTKLRFEYAKIKPWLSSETKIEVDTFHDNYYGVGNDTDPDSFFELEPIRLELSTGPKFHFSHSLSFETSTHYSFLREKNKNAIQQQSGVFEGVIDGNTLGLRFELVHDTRDTPFSTRYGGRRGVWVEPWILQGSGVHPRLRMGGYLHQFIPLYAPDWIMALRLEGGSSVGQRGYLTNFSLGGKNRLRGYDSNRFRGDHYALGTSELRFPIWSFVSGAAFGEIGKVWVDGRDDQWTDIGYVGGAGLRFGLPPDFLVKLRFDVGFAPDQWGMFFFFNEVF